MTNYQCPKCELRFNWRTEVDDHCWHDHPEFRHEYPARTVPPAAVEKLVPTAQAPRVRQRNGASELWAWLQPASRKAAAAVRKSPDPDAPEPRHAAD